MAVSMNWGGVLSWLVYIMIIGMSGRLRVDMSIGAVWLFL